MHKNPIWSTPDRPTIVDIKANEFLGETVKYICTAATEKTGEATRERATRFLIDIGLADDGLTIRSLIPELSLHFTSPAVSYRRIGITQEELRAQITTPPGKAMRCLPDPILDEIWPEPIRLMLGWMIMATSEEINARVECAMKCAAKRGLAAKSIDGHAKCLKSVLSHVPQILKTIAERLAPEAAAEPGTQRTLGRLHYAHILELPLAASYGAHTKHRSTVGSTLIELRRRFQELFDAAYPRGLDGPIGGRSHLKRFNAFCLTVLFGPRCGSFEWFLASSYDPAHHFPVSNSYDPALWLTISMTKMNRKGRKVPPVSQAMYLPPLLATSIERQISEFGLEPSDQLFENGRNWVQGTCKSTNPLFPRTIDPDKPAPLPGAKGSYYSHHKQRHSTLQLIEQLVEPAHNRRAGTGLEPEYRRTTTPLMDAALTGHKLSAAFYDTNGYYDTSDPDRKALLCRQIITALWELLTTDEGARKVPDWDAHEAARIGLDRIAAQLEELDEVLDDDIATLAQRHAPELKFGEGGDK